MDAPVVVLSRRALRERQLLSRAVETSTVRVFVEPDSAAVVEPVSAFEPVSVVEPVSVFEAEATEPDVDAFEAASRAFCFDSGEPVQIADDSAQESGGGGADPAAPGERKGRRLVAAGASLGIMGVAAMIAVSMTMPSGAVTIAQGAQAQSATSLVTASKQQGSSLEDDEIQAYVASSDVQNDVIHRADGFSTASLIDLATEQGITYSNSVFTNNPDAAIQWPFIVGVGMSYGYGMRDGRLHEGLDLIPGSGAPVQAIAGGKVRIATESGGNYGVTVYIDHMVDGELITSHYSHMQYDSLEVVAGQTVEVGDIVGKVGNTGRSFGAHMHFELIVDGSTIDPLPWLEENAGRNDGVSSVS